MYYSHNAIEKKWQKFWSTHNSFATPTANANKKKYILDMFPYPSGKGLHVGHPRGYTATDVLARMFRMQGFEVLHPIGWDAFGLPAEQYAIKTKKNPAEFTAKNIAKFREQLQKLGLSYDYSKEVNTSEPSYYKHTQLIFSLLYKAGLAEIQNINVNWCPELNTVLANEELINVNGQLLSERGGHPVVKRAMRQWVLKIRDYADQLLEGLQELKWHKSIKDLQRNWIGKTEGLYWPTTIQGAEGFSKPWINIFFNTTQEFKALKFVKISMESPLADWLKTTNVKIKDYIDQFINLSNLDRVNISTPKEGIQTNCWVVHPITKVKIPIWLVNYVDSDEHNFYTAGIVETNKIDYLFTKKYNFSGYKNTFSIIHKNFMEQADAEDDKKTLIENNILKPGSALKLHNWIFSRQRYWGEPIPILHLDSGDMVLVPEQELPVVLPPLSDLNQDAKGLAPLSKSQEWIHTTYQSFPAIREANTMPQWAGSCWYYIAYILKQTDGTYLDIRSPEAKLLLDKWLPVDIYVGGQEHAVLHLLYARFWHKFLYNSGIISSSEPFQKLINQGMILGPGGQKMSKSKGNIIGIDEVVRVHGADALRLNELFMGPIDMDMAWSERTLDACRHWLDRVYRLVHFGKVIDAPNPDLEFIFHKTVKEVSERITNYSFNTAISSLMVFINHCYKTQAPITKAYFLGFIKLLSCFAPHVSQEMWSILGQNTDLTTEKWPKFDPKVIDVKAVKIPVQINGKTKTVLNVPIDLSKQDLEKAVMSNALVKSHLQAVEIKKIIVVPNKIVNILI